MCFCEPHHPKRTCSHAHLAHDLSQSQLTAAAGINSGVPWTYEQGGRDLAKLNTVTCPQLQAGEHPDRWGDSERLRRRTMGQVKVPPLQRMPGLSAQYRETALDRQGRRSPEKQPHGRRPWGCHYAAGVFQRLSNQFPSPGLPVVPGSVAGGIVGSWGTLGSGVVVPGSGAVVPGGSTGSTGGW